MVRKARIPRNCVVGRHELEIDMIRYVSVQRCKYCQEIPDAAQKAMWDFELDMLEKFRELPLSARFAEVKRRVMAEMERRQYVNP